MKTVFAYIQFKQIQTGGKTSSWEIINIKSGGVLGWLGWYGPWRQYCSELRPDVVFSAGCHDDVSAFIKELMQARKEKAT